MATARLFRTSTFQIAILYLALFGATLAGTLAFIYWSTADLIERQMNETIQAEIKGLAEQYRDEGLTRLTEIIRERSGRSGSPENVYLLTGPLYRPLAGNLEVWPKEPEIRDGWAEIQLHRKDDPADRAHTIRARLFDLAGGFHLLVGRDTAERGDFRRIMEEGIAWALIPILLVGLADSYIVGRAGQRHFGRPLCATPGRCRSGHQPRDRQGRPYETGAALRQRRRIRPARTDHQRYAG
jgi:hypothetical protein